MKSGAPTLSALLARSDLTDHEEVLRAANAALKKSKTDVWAQRTRVVALLKLDRYEDALRVCEEGGDKLKKEAPLEYAYALYKTGNLVAAVNTAETGADTNERGLLHVLAQTAYRLEDFAKAAEIYNGLSSRLAGAEHEENDLRVNGAAVDAQLEWQGKGHLVVRKKPGREDLEAFETAYNAACGSIARGELVQGEVLLRRAKDLCNALDEFSEEDKNDEILVQQIYVLVRLGRLEEAEKLSSDVGVADIFDVSLRHIAQVNSLTTSLNPPNPFLAHRTFHSTEEGTKSDQPFEYQSRALKEDSRVLDLLTLKHDGLAASTAKILSQCPTSTTDPAITTVSVIHAAAAAQNAAGKAGIKAILPLLEKWPNDVGLLLTIIQLYVLTNNHGSAIALLESFFARLEQQSTPADQDVRFAPGLVATAVSLYSTQSQRTQVRNELANAAAYWRQKYKSSSDADGIRTATGLLKAAGTELLSTSNASDRELAASIFSNLHAAMPSDPAAIAGLVASHAVSDPSAISSSSLDSLPQAQRLVVGINAAELEAAGVASLPTPVSTTVKRSGAERKAKERKAEEPLKKKRKLSAKRTPKDFVEGKEMDPERWLPMKDRSNYRPKGKKKKGKASGGGTQGGIVEDEVEGSKPAQAPSGGGGGGSGGGKKKGKRKGGAKW